jgi:hypothetical protein
MCEVLYLMLLIILHTEGKCLVISSCCLCGSLHLLSHTQEVDTGSEHFFFNAEGSNQEPCA